MGEFDDFSVNEEAFSYLVKNFIAFLDHAKELDVDPEMVVTLLLTSASHSMIEADVLETEALAVFQSCYKACVETL